MAVEYTADVVADGVNLVDFGVVVKRNSHTFFFLLFFKPITNNGSGYN